MTVGQELLSGLAFSCLYYSVGKYTFLTAPLGYEVQYWTGRKKRQQDVSENTGEKRGRSLELEFGASLTLSF